MRVLIVTDWKTPEGGTEQYANWLRAALREAGDDARLLTSSAGSAAFGTADYVAYGSGRTLEQVGLQVVNPSAVATMRRALREMRPDAVVVHMFEMHLSPAVLWPLRDVPTVLMVHYYKPICPTGLKLLPDGRQCEHEAGLVCMREGCSSPPLWLRDRPRYALIRRGLRHFDRVLTVSPWMVRRLGESGLESELLALPIAAPPEGFSRAPADDPLLVYTGRLAPEKSLDVLVRAFASVRSAHPAARLRLVGQGPERGSVIALARDLGVLDAVELPGAVASADVPAELAAAWAVVIASTVAEAGSTSGLEALVHGVPLITGRAGGVADDIEPGRNGWLFDNGDVDSLAAALESAVSGGPAEVPAELVAAVRERHRPDAHLERMRRVLADVSVSGRSAEQHGPLGERPAPGVPA